MRKGDWCQTFTGLQFWPLDPRPEEICIEDIAHALALTCRFNGHCRCFYSVAQHSYLVSQECGVLDPDWSPIVQLWGLLHDAAEAYIGDMVRPLKRDMPAFKDAERAIMRAVCTRFDLPMDEPAIVKHADNILLATEARDLMGAPPVPWMPLPEPLPFHIAPASPDMAERMFLSMFKGLREE